MVFLRLLQIGIIPLIEFEYNAAAGKFNEFPLPPMPKMQ